ncbi:MAG: signal recognition particle-docking protein FtsY [Proteobacteria bacterium]|nr:signal recognition particle-docking protein FtsY [Pseudomonadota bacterium]MBI3496477.1 signal recognition particle-docking protein FtsY [Pseudomonadota bacterium]
MGGGNRVVTGWLARLKTGLGKTAARLGGGIADLVTKRRLDQAMLDELEELLIQADLGVEAAGRLIEDLKQNRFDKEVTPDEVRRLFAEDIARLLAPVQRPLTVDPRHRPHVVLIVGVNGSGKTTTLGKLAALMAGEGRRVMVAACDTFRAAAIEQLAIWCSRAGVPVVTGAPGADAAGVAFEALERAQREGIDVLLIDTAGRLHNKAGLMAELDKLIRVLKKRDPSAPHDTLLVLDATIGQNAHQQVEVFRAVAQVSGLAVTKLDGTAKGGVLVALAQRFGLPVHWIGIGEGLEDLRPFEAGPFARGLMGLEAESHT